MTKTTLEIFYEICAIPHPSGDTAALRDFIVQRAKAGGCAVECDRAGNIHLLKGAPKICLQAHCDMVLMGESSESAEPNTPGASGAPLTPVEPIVRGDFLCAKNSSLGADNGIGVAAILYFCAGAADFEALITNDEEIGMLGAKALTLEIVAPKILNLDSEEISTIIAGCAGAFEATIPLETAPKRTKLRHFYELSAQHFIGGHSGIDIAKSPKNAIIELLWALQKLPNARILKIKGGEKLNSIPTTARAIVGSKKPLDLDRFGAFSNDRPANESTASESPENDQPDAARPKNDRPQLSKIRPPHPSIKIQKITQNLAHLRRQKSFSKKALKPLCALHSGVYEMRESCVVSSLNVSKISKKSLKIMARGNVLEGLLRQKSALKTRFPRARFGGFYAPWEREDSPFLEEIKNAYAKNGLPCEVGEIHAGLECGFLRDKCREIASIGPSIFNPHSTNERLDLRSFEAFMAVLSTLLLGEKKQEN